MERLTRFSLSLKRPNISKKTEIFAALDFLIQCSLTSQEVLGRYRQGGAETDESTELFFIPAETVRQERYRQALWHKSAL